MACLGSAGVRESHTTRNWDLTGVCFICRRGPIPSDLPSGPSTIATVDLGPAAAAPRQAWTGHVTKDFLHHLCAHLNITGTFVESQVTADTVVVCITCYRLTQTLAKLLNELEGARVNLADYLSQLGNQLPVDQADQTTLQGLIRTKCSRLAMLDPQVIVDNALSLPNAQSTCVFCPQRVSFLDWRTHLMVHHPDILFRSKKLDHVSYSRFQHICLQVARQQRPVAPRLFEASFCGCVYCPLMYAQADVLQWHMFDAHLDRLADDVIRVQEADSAHTVDEDHDRQQITIQQLQATAATRHDDTPVTSDEPLRSSTPSIMSPQAPLPLSSSLDRTVVTADKVDLVAHCTTGTLPEPKDPDQIDSRFDAVTSVDSGRHVPSCHLCGQVCPTECRLRLHMFNRHVAQGLLHLKMTNVPDAVFTAICNNVLTPTRERDSQGTLPCPWCAKGYAGAQYLRVHIIDRHHLEMTWEISAQQTTFIKNQTSQNI